MNYNSILKVVRAQNPDIPWRDQQKKASDIMKKLKLNKDELSGKDGGSVTEAPVFDPVSEEIFMAEKRLRSNVIDVNSLISIGREVIPHGELVKHGKDGVNTKVTFEDGFGHRLPASGYFTIYI